MRNTIVNGLHSFQELGLKDYRSSLKERDRS